MAFTLVQGASRDNPNLIFGANLTAANAVWVAVRWEGATGSVNASMAIDGNALTMLTRVDAASGDLHSQAGYMIGSLPNNATVNITLDGAATFAEAHGYEFHAGGETITIDQNATGTGSGTALASGAITLASAAMWAVFGFGNSYSSGQTYSSPTVNGVAADGSTTPVGSQYATGFYDLLTSSFASGTAACTASASDAWIQHITSFKAGSAGGETITADKWLSQERIVRGPRYRVVTSGLTPPTKIN